MDEDNRHIIKDSIQDAFDLKGEYSTWHIESNFQLLLSQLDLFKTISSIIIAVLGLGYIFDQKLVEGEFLIASFVSAIIVFFWTLSYTRENIDLQVKQNEITGKSLREKTDEWIEIALKALKEKNPDIFFEYSKKESQIKHPENKLIYAGEIFNFMLYLSVGFLMLGFIANKYHFIFLSYQTTALCIFLYVLSFKNWAVKLVGLLSSKIKL